MTDTSQASAATDLADGLRASVTGEVVAPDAEAYDDARAVFNAAVDRRPALVVFAAGASDVASTVKVAREHGVELVVRGGRHSFAGNGASDGGVVLDTSRMRGLAIDPEARIGEADAGVTAAEYTAAAGEHGLATGFGDAGPVGIAGLTLGGGIGWLLRKHGLTIDSLLGAELVTADGELVEADADTNPDLFWALRGGGGNFGVVTRLRYQLHELDGILGGMLLLPATPEVLMGYVEAADSAPDELSMIAHVNALPPLPFVPPEHHGKLALMVMLVFAGDAEAGQEAVAPLRALATPLADMVSPMSYPEIYALGGEGPPRSQLAIRSSLIDDWDEGMAAKAIERVQGAELPMAMCQLRVLGGAMARVPADATAFAHRGRRLMVTAGAMNPGPGDPGALEDWVDGTAAALGLQGQSTYVNYVGAGEGPERVHDAYPAATYERLAEVKRRWDPENVFHVNQNVEPAAL
jgi:FAD/FMN-containing dehydrogenase